MKTEEKTIKSVWRLYKAIAVIGFVIIIIVIVSGMINNNGFITIIKQSAVNVETHKSIVSSAR